MRSIRAYLFKNREFIYPESSKPADLSTFFGVLAGHQIKNSGFELSEGTGEYDNNGIEIFTKDVIIVHYLDVNDRKGYSEVARIHYHDGCFNAVNDNGLDVDIGSCIRDDEHYAIIIGNEYEGEYTYK
jgi:hypothetical protein